MLIPLSARVRAIFAPRPGLSAPILMARGISGIAIDRKFVSYIASDSAEDQAKAIAALKKL